MITEIELSGIKYPITVHENVYEEDIVSYTFSTLVNGRTYLLHTKYTTKQLNSPPTFGISAEEELRDIMYHELKSELFGIVYNTSVAKQYEIASECKNDEELLAAAAHDTVFAAWLYNFDRK